MAVTEILGYQTTDGCRFFSRDSAEKHDREYLEIEPIMARIPKTELKHGTYKQHDAEMLRQIKRDLWPFVLKYVNAEVHFRHWLTWDADQVHPHSIVARVLDGDSPICRAWASFSRFNFDLGREYDQPYFAVHPYESTEAA